MKKSLLLFSLFTLLFACKNNTQEVLLNHTNLKDEVSKKGIFEFVFDEDLVPDSILNLWDKTEYVNFNPKIEGEYKWTAKNTLIFLPKYELRPASNYDATITSEVLKHVKDKKLNVEKITFFTRKLALIYNNVFWTKKDNQDIVRLSLNFNERVNAEDLKKYLELKKDDKKVAFNLIPTELGTKVDFDLPEIKKSDDDLVIDIQINKGLKPVNGQNASDEFLKHVLLNSPYRITINSVTSEHTGTSGSLDVSCSQKINLKNIKNFITISPKVKYTVTASDNGFIIKSDHFSATDKYVLSIKKGIQGVVGGKLKSDYAKDITFGKLKPEIKFEKDKAFYLSALGSKNIETKIVSVAKVKVVISKVYENNLLTARSQDNFFNTSSDYYDSYYDDYYDDYYYDDYYGSNQELKDVIFEKTYTTTDLPKIGSARLLKLDFFDKLKEYKGIYHIDIHSEDDRYLSDARYVSVSDIGIIAKNGENYMTVFLNSLKTSNAIANAKIKVYGNNNQLAGEGITDSEGTVRITLKNKEISGFKPSMITASAGEDYNILMFKDTRVNTSDFELSGIRIPKNGLQTFIYPERDLYRPGEKVNFAVIVRENEWKIPAKLPIKLEIRTPNGKLLKTIKKTLNSEGSFDASFETVAASQTGSYIINVISSNGVFLAGKAIKVEEFMPDRIKVKADLDKDLYSIGEEATININAQNLFGTPAANRNYEVEVNFKRAYIYPKGLENYSFYLNNRNNNFSSEVFEGTTDAKGDVVETFEIPNSYANMGKLTATIYSTVFDETNRPVNRRNTADISTQNAYYGIGYFDYYVGTNNQIDIPLVAVDKNEKILKGTKAKVKIIKHEYRTILNKSGSYYTYNSQRYERIIKEETITLNGKETFSFNPALSGRYEVRISSVAAPNAYVSQSFYAYSWGSTNNNSFEVNNEGKVDMQFDKEKYELGENATILLKTPFDGKVLVTVERDDVLEHFYVNTQNRSAEISFMTTSEFLPNVFVTATLFKEHKQTEFPLTVAHGFKLMKVVESTREMNVEITATKETRSRTKQTIKVKASPNSKVSIAVVDEGILQVSGFNTPNPYGYFYQNRALLVNSYDLYPFLFKEISADNAGAGGDDFDLSKRVNPMENNRVKLVSFWSGLVETDGSGKTSFEIDIPQFSGSLRVMAVAHKGNSFGSAEENIIVADPIIMSSSIPRFFSPGDTAIVTTTLTNTTKKDTKAKASIKCSNSLQVISNSKQTVSINSKGEQQVSFKVYVKQDIGQAKITVSCDALGEEFIEETDISIRPASSLLKESGSGTIKAGNSKELNLNRANYIESSSSYKLVVSKNPMVEFAKQLDYLVRYPYGCSEQTVSAAFPQLYFADISKALYKDDSKADDINNNINAAITKLKMRQIYNGGITMWDNGSSPSWWITAFATHFAIEAKNAGYHVDQAFIDKMIGYLQNRLKSKETVNYYYDRGKTKRIAPREVAYSFYALALAGKSDVSLMNYYKSKTDLLSLDSKYLLSAAYAMSGDKAKAKEILPSVFSGEVSDKQFGGSFYSPIRDEAIALNALLSIDPKNNQIGTMAMHLSKELKERRYMNTQEKVFTLLALGKIAKQASESTIAATINSGGSKIGNYSEGTASFSKQIKNGKVNINVKGSGTLYYFWETEGISKDGKYIEEDSYLKIRKTFYDRHGNVITGRTFKPNDLIVIKLSINTSYDKTVENVAITDVLPACFEIENPRTDEIPGTEWIKNQTIADYVDVRDDRINLFDDIYARYNKTSQDYYYVVRVVSKGTFRMGPASADAMYNGEYHSYHGGGVITVK